MLSNIYLCRYQRRLLEANADGSQLATLDDTGTMSVYALKRGQASTVQLDFQAEGVTSVVWNTDHAEVHLFLVHINNAVHAWDPPLQPVLAMFVV